MAPEDVQRWFICLCAFGSVALLVWWAHATYLELAARAALAEERRRAISSFLLLMLAPAANAFARWLGPRLDRLEEESQTSGHTSFLVALRRRAETMLTGAGRPHGLAPNEIMGLWVVCRILAALVGVLCYAMLLKYWPGVPAVLMVPFLAAIVFLPELFGFWVITGIVLLLVALLYYAWLLAYWPGSPSAILLPFLLIGFLEPWIWLRDRERARKRAIRRDLPYALDLLTLSVEAGLDFTAALARIVRRRPGRALSDELAETLRQIQMGVPRAEALRDLHDRVRMDELFSVTSALIQADELGASLGPILRIQAETFRIRRAQAAEKQAMEAPVKLLFPLICFFFPATFIVLFGPIIIGLFLRR
jgi:hypothetical protein